MLQMTERQRDLRCQGEQRKQYKSWMSPKRPHKGPLREGNLVDALVLGLSIMSGSETLDCDQSPTSVVTHSSRTLGHLL